MTIFWHWTGPLLRYGDGVLDIQDLNPELKTKWRLSRWQMARIGMRCLIAAIRP